MSTHADEVLTQNFIRESSTNIATVIANALSNEEASNCDLERLQRRLRDAVDGFASNVRREFSRRQTGKRISIASWRAFSRRQDPLNLSLYFGESRFGRRERESALEFVDSQAERLVRVVRQHAGDAGITMIVHTTLALASGTERRHHLPSAFL